MPFTTSRNLTLDTVGSNVRITVKYSAVFSKFERFCAAHGLRFQERITVLGVDGIIGTPTVLHNFPPTELVVTPGDTSLTIPRNVSITRTRASLQEDAGLGDADEIRCEIRILPIGMAAVISDITDTETLAG